MSRKNARRRPSPADPTLPCPCGLGQPYQDCCGRFHSGEQTAPSPELLMRSRYSAFAVENAAYLLETWHPTTRPPGVDFEPGLRWIGLEILGTTGGSAFRSEGTVEFEARFVVAGRHDVLRENSSFTREGGRWMYVNAIG